MAQSLANSSLVMAIDTGHLMREPLNGIPNLDHAINNGLVLGYACLRHGDRIGMFGFDSKMRLFTEPVGGTHHFNYFLKASADLESRPEETNFTLAFAELLTQLKQRSLVILQTEFVDTTMAELMIENVERLAARHVVIFVTLRDPSLHDIVNAPPTRPASINAANTGPNSFTTAMLIMVPIRSAIPRARN